MPSNQAGRVCGLSMLVGRYDMAEEINDVYPNDSVALYADYLSNTHGRIQLLFQR